MLQLTLCVDQIQRSRLFLDTLHGFRKLRFVVGVYLGFVPSAADLHVVGCVVGRKTVGVDVHQHAIDRRPLGTVSSSCVAVVDRQWTSEWEPNFLAVAATNVQTSILRVDRRNFRQLAALVADGLIALRELNTIAGVELDAAFFIGNEARIARRRPLEKTTVFPLQPDEVAVNAVDMKAFAFLG